MERLYSIDSVDNCIICGSLVVCGKKLTAVTNFSNTPIFQLIQEFTDTCFSEDILQDVGVCNDCMQKCNDFDQHKLMANQLQQEIINLFNSNMSAAAEENRREDVKEEEEIQPLVYEFEEVQMNEPDESLINETIEMADTLEPNFVEVDYLETNKLPKKLQRSEEKQLRKILRSKPTKSTDDEFTVVQLENNIKLFQCDVCCRTFKEKSKLKSHKLIHTTERNIFCGTCGKSFKTQACLRSHKRVHNPIVIECDYCGKTYTQKPELIKHIQFIHFNRRDYVCDLCNAAFGCRGHLKAHYLTHQQYRGISCQICGYSFHTQAKLQRHMKSHTGERDYECGLCHKRFLYSYNVSAHIRHVHWKEKRKVDDTTRTCKFCSKKFQKIWKLHEHMQVEHEFIETEEIIDESQIIEDSNVYEVEELVEA